jgi:hypothetical protein
MINLRNPEIYKGMTNEQILKERIATRATFEKLLGYTVKPAIIAHLHEAIADIDLEIASVEAAIRNT